MPDRVTFAMETDGLTKLLAEYPRVVAAQIRPVAFDTGRQIASAAWNTFRQKLTVTGEHARGMVVTDTVRDHGQGIDNDAGVVLVYIDAIPGNLGIWHEFGTAHIGRGKSPTRPGLRARPWFLQHAKAATAGHLARLIAAINQATGEATR